MTHLLCAGMSEFLLVADPDSQGQLRTLLASLPPRDLVQERTLDSGDIGILVNMK
jgi:hypothetical protein